MVALTVESNDTFLFDDMIEWSESDMEVSRLISLISLCIEWNENDEVIVLLLSEDASVRESVERTVVWVALLHDVIDESDGSENKSNAPSNCSVT